MLIQWRYKVIKIFANNSNQFYCGKEAERFMKLRHYGMFVYKPTKRKYDYVDYTGRIFGEDVDSAEITQMLEFLGYIKFVEKKNGRT